MVAAGATKGDVAGEVSQPVECELIVEKVVQVPLRDGTILSCDVFRPAIPG